jgi:glycosyltransferase involved in cell wall biosynthesis
VAGLVGVGAAVLAQERFGQVTGSVGSGHLVLLAVQGGRVSTGAGVASGRPGARGQPEWLFRRLAAARKAKKPFELQDHGGLFAATYIEGGFLWLRQRLARFLAKRANMIRTVNPASFDWLKCHGYERKTYFLPIAARDFSSIIARRVVDPDLIITASRLVSVKRIDLLIRAFVELKKQRTQARLVILGEGPLKQPLIDLATRLGVASSVEFVGYQDPAVWFERAALFVLFSQQEGWGVAPVEATTAGVPVLMTNTGAAPWLAERQAAALACSDQPSDSARDMSKALDAGYFRPLKDFMTAEQVRDVQMCKWSELSQEKKSLLVCVQAVDEDDRLMGFFVEWLQAAAQEFSELHVLALRVGRYELPENVYIYQTGDRTDSLKAYSTKTTALSRVIRRFRILFRVMGFSWKLRKRYDAVFVRGDAIYVLLFSWLWRVFGKAVLLWYAHYKSNRLIPWAYRFASAIVTSAPEACAYPGVKPIAIGQAINHERFVFRERSYQKPFQALALGRVLPIKGIKNIVEDVCATELTNQYKLEIVGPSLDADYEIEIDQLIRLNSHIRWNKAGVSYDQVPILLQEKDFLLNAYPGSLDKVIVEAMLSGVIPVFATSALNYQFPVDYAWLYAPTSEIRRDVLRKLSVLSVAELRQCAQTLRDFAYREHSLAFQVKRLHDVVKRFV